MKGSLDNPPVLIFSSRWKSLLVLAGCLAFVAMGAFMLKSMNSDDPQRRVAYLCIGFFGLGSPLMAWRFLFPDSLLLAPEGIVWRSALRTMRWTWQEVGNFQVCRITRSGTVGFDFSPSYTKQIRLRATNKSLFGVEGSFTGGWEIGPDELARLLNAARARWCATSFG
jgi:hypothetical protein